MFKEPPRPLSGWRLGTAWRAEDSAASSDAGSPAIRIYFNFANPLQNGRDLYQELRALGKDRICQIHASNQDGVWLESDPQIDLPKVRQTLDAMGWSGWLVIKRSRDANDPRNVVRNFGANTAYLKKVFQQGWASVCSCRPPRGMNPQQ